MKYSGVESICKKSIVFDSQIRPFVAFLSLSVVAVGFIGGSVDRPTLEVDSCRFALRGYLLGEDENLPVDDLVDLVDIVGKLFEFIFDLGLDEF